MTTTTTHNDLPSVETLSDLSVCCQPRKRIHTGDDIEPWLRSTAYRRLMSVLARLNAAVRGQLHEEQQEARASGRSQPLSATSQGILDMLDRLDAWVDEIPLDTRVQRFGNRAFRDWAARLEEEARPLHERWLPLSTHGAVLPELLYYFTQAFGNATRLDYGSGHELSFLGYLTVLRYTGLLDQEDEADMVLVLFRRYLETCRKLQRVYRLEPAGSKGVWGLEDHQFLNLLWGSSQLCGHPNIQPGHILRLQTLPQPTVDSSLFLSSIAHIHAIKRGPFNEHSPVLHSIASTVPTWQKVNSGLIKMYQAEVLEKHPVVQHFWFGGVLPWTDAETGQELPTSALAAAAVAEEVEADLGNDLPGGAPTKAPWAVTGSTRSGDAHPRSTTAAPRAATAAPMGAATAAMPPMAATGAPWASPANQGIPFIPLTTGGVPAQSARASRLPFNVQDGPTRFATGSAGTSRPLAESGISSRGGRQTTLAATGSAAAMSSPMGAISQPSSYHPSSRQGRG